MRVDVHNHVMPRAALDLITSHPVYGVRIQDGTWTGAHHVPFPVYDSYFDPSARLEELERAGLDGAVVSPAPPIFYYDVDVEASAELCAATNEGMADFCRHSPDRLRWMAHLPMQSPERAARTLVEAADAGAAGAAVGTSIAGRRLDEPAYEAFWEVAASRKLPVLIHPAFNEHHAALEPWYLQNVCGNPIETTVTATRLMCAGVPLRHPDLRIILMHGGGFLPYQAGRLMHARGVRPELEEAPTDLLQQMGQFYFDTVVHNTEVLRFLVARVGVDNVVIGTDMPYDMGSYKPIEALASVAEPAVIARIAEENPARLYGSFDRRDT